MILAELLGMSISNTQFVELFRYRKDSSCFSIFPQPTTKVL
jgi:hypothetical protein